MCVFNLAFCFIFLIILYSQPFCKGATHWIVTEDGRIQQQTDSIFNLKSPFDLVTFIHQQNAFDRLQVLREEYLQEKKKLIEGREKEREEIRKSFYKMDPDCVDAGNHISEFELHLDMTLPFTKKGINIPDHVNLCQPLPSSIEPPLCRAELPTIMYSYDHLEGVNSRHQLNTSTEPTLLTVLSSYFKTVDELGAHVGFALEKNSSSWVLLNLAAYYWRITGNAFEAIECLRQALYFSPREHKDRALMSLAAVLHHANHSHDSVVLLHSAVDTSSELSIYHFVLGNIYASLKMYEMAELCYRFTMVISPDTKLLCERIKAVRCEMKLKELFQERQLDFDEVLDSLKTPELDVIKDQTNREAEKKPLLPLETYKKQLNRVFALIQGEAKYKDICKSRTGAAKQESRLSSDHAEGKGMQTGHGRERETQKSTHSQQDSNHQTENISSGIKSKPTENAVFITEAVEANTHSEMKLKSGNKNNEEIGSSIGKEEGTTSETLEASDNTNISVEERTMRNLAEARVALKRLKSIIKTVSRARSSASSTVDVSNEGGSQVDSNIDSKTSAKTIPSQSKMSSIQSTPTVDEKESKVRKVGNPGRTGRRGESGFKVLKSKEDGGKVVITEESKISKKKGESTLMSKNGPGFDKIASKNAREISNVELPFEEPKEGRPIGPKHTPPLEGKSVLAQGKNCENLGRKKRKGEAFAMECLNQEPRTQGQSSITETGEGTKQRVSTTEFSKAKATSTATSPLLSDAEAILMKQTSPNEISATAASSANASERTSEAEVGEKGERKTPAVEDVAKSRTSDKGSDSENGNGEAASEKSDSKVFETSGKESENVKQHDHMASGGNKYSDPKIEKSEVKISFVEDEKIKTSSEGSENFKKVSRSNTGGETSDAKEKSETKDFTTVDMKSTSSEKESENLKQHYRATTAGEKNHEKTNKEKTGQKNTEFKSSKAHNSDKASQSIKEKVKEAEFLHKVGTGSSVFETSFMNVQTAGPVQEPSEDECKHIEGIQALVIRNKQFSAWLSLDTKNIDVRTHIDFLSEVDDVTKKPRCTAKVKSNLHTFGNLQGVANAAKLDQVAEAGLTQTLLTIGRTMVDSVDEMGTRIYNALKKNATSWVLLNIASLYWRVQGDTAEAIKCLRQALYFSPANTKDVAHVGLASILLREGQLDDTAVVIKKALEISPSLALGHFILGNVFGAQSNIPEAIQHYLLALQLEPGFMPAVERLKIIQCVLWKQQQALEKEAEDLRKLLTPN